MAKIGGDIRVRQKAAKVYEGYMKSWAKSGGDKKQTKQNKNKQNKTKTGKEDFHKIAQEDFFS